MGTLALAGASYADLTQSLGAATPLEGVYYALPPYGDAPCEDAPEYEDVQMSFPGVDGVGIKRLGFRGRNIRVTLVILGMTKANCEARKDTLFASLTPLARFSITLPGGTARPGCRLLPGGASSESWSSVGVPGATRNVLIVKLNLRQMSLV